MKNHVIMFQPWKGALVEKGASLQTVRPPRKRPIKPGDTLSLRQWTGAPYRSKQREFRRATVVSVQPVEMTKKSHSGIVMLKLAAIWLDRQQCEVFAKLDGFANADEMLAWFYTTHELPFKGSCIRWTLSP